MTITKVTVKNNSLKFYTKRFICRSISRFIPLIFFFFSTSVVLNIRVFTSHFMILKIFYMSLFGHFRFWAPNYFPDVIWPRYNPGVMYIFLFLRFYNFIRGLCAYVQYFQKKLRLLFLYLTLQLVRIFASFNKTHVFFFSDKLTSMKKKIVLIFSYILPKARRKQLQSSFFYSFLADFSGLVM